MLVVEVEAVEEVAGRQHREVAVALARSAKSLAGPGTAAGSASHAGRASRRCRVLGGRASSSRGSDRPARERLGAERLGPAAGRVAELAGQEADHRVGDVVRPGVVGERRAGRRRPRRGASARSPTTLLDGVTLTMLPRMSLAAAYMSSICSNFSPSPRAIACCRRLDSWPPGISWRVDAAGRRGQSRLERRVQPPGGLPVRLEVADRRERQAGRAVGLVGGGDQGRQRGLARRAGQRGATRRRRRRPPRRSRPAGSPAGRRVCRGCAGAPAGRSARAARRRGSERPAPAAVPPCP